MKLAELTSRDNYFEDFVVGAKYEHARGKTVTEMDGVLITNMVMNTAQGHFNEDQMSKGPMGQRIVFGGVTASMVIGPPPEPSNEPRRINEPPLATRTSPLPAR